MDDRKFGVSGAFPGETSGAISAMGPTKDAAMAELARKQAKQRAEADALRNRPPTPPTAIGVRG